MRPFFRIGIAKQFIFLFILIFLIPVLTLGGFFAIEVFRVKQQNTAELAYAAKLQKDRVEEIVLAVIPDPNSAVVRDTQNALIKFQSDATPKNFSELNSSLSNVQQSNSAYRRVSIFDENGIVIASSSDSDIGQSYLNREMFSRKIQTSGFREFEWGRRMLFGYYQIGDLNIKIDLSSLIELQSAFSALSETGEIELVRDNLDGSVELITPTRFTAQQQGPFLIPLSLTSSPEVRSLNRTEQTYVDLVDYRGMHVYSATQYIPSLDWGLVVKKDRTEILVPISNLRTVVIFAVPLSILLLIMAGLYLKKHVTSPIEKLTQTAIKISHGDYSKRADLSFKNEIGELAKAFNTMSDELIDANQNLEKRINQKTAQLQRTLTKIKEEKQKDTALLSSIGESVIATDNKGNIIFINQSAEQLFDVKRKDVVGVPVYGLISLRSSGEKVDRKSHPVAQTLRNRVVIRSKEFEFVRREESLIVEVTVSPVEFDSDIFGAIMVVRDVTKEKIIDRMKSEFIFLASHQLRGPLASLKWSNEMLLNGEEGKLTKEQNRFIGNMSNATERMIKLVDDFLNMARIERGEIKFEPSQVQIEKVIQEVVSALKEEVEKKSIRIQLENLSRTQTAYTDQRMIREVIWNILQNAVKYSSEQGQITVHLSDKDGQMRIEVADQGPGIPTISQSHIFSKLFRATNVPVSGSAGTGLGLYTAKRLIDRMGGKIGFTSTQGKGSTFWISLPLKKTIS